MFKHQKGVEIEEYSITDESNSILSLYKNIVYTLH